MQVAIERKYATFVDRTMRIRAGQEYNPRWVGVNYGNSHHSYTAASPRDYYIAYGADLFPKGRSMIAWYAWMKRVDVDEGFNPSACTQVEHLPSLNDKAFETLDDVPYDIYL
jgi:hypothetical protein